MLVGQLGKHLIGLFKLGRPDLVALQPGGMQIQPLIRTPGQFDEHLKVFLKLCDSRFVFRLSGLISLLAAERETLSLSGSHHLPFPDPLLRN